MRIVLMRHGKPLPQSETLASSLDFKLWIDAFNAAAIDQTQSPSTEAIHLAQGCNAVVCSNLLRSVSSARLLGLHRIHSCAHQLREMEIPCGNWPLVKLKPHYWAVFFRILWFVGYCNNSESFKEARHRADRAAQLLEDLATEKESVLFVGHGLLNRFIARSLLKRGWREKQPLSTKYWGLGIFEMPS